MFSFGRLPSILSVLSFEELEMVRKYAETEDEREHRELMDIYAALDEDGWMDIAWEGTQMKVRTRSHAKRHSTASAYTGLSSDGAGSSSSLVKRLARRAERRAGKEMIKEQA